MKKIISIAREFSKDRISREAGEKLRTLIVQAGYEHQQLVIDFNHLIVASTSFLDEGLAKLADEGWTARDVDKKIVLKNIHPLDRELLQTLSQDRWPKSGCPRWKGEKKPSGAN